MKDSNSKLITTIIPILVLATVAAIGWFNYYSELDKNQSLVLNSQSEQGKLGIRLEQQQATIVSLQADATALQSRLEAENKSRQELTAMLEQTSAEKIAVESHLQAEVERVESTIVELEKRQTTINQLLEDETNLQAKLDSQEKSRQALAAMLEKTTAEKIAIQSSLQGEVKRVTLTTAELEAELQRRQAAQESLHDEISTISGEKSALVKQLEQEQESKRQIANLKSRLEQELNESRVEISQLKNQMTVIKLTSEVLFGSGSARIKPAGEKVLAIIAESLNAYPRRAISVEGHTDNKPIKNAHYQSNWELSAARGLAAINYFQQQARVDPKRLKVVGYGQYHPVSSNETAEGRKQNRRIEIRLLPPGSVNVAQN